MKTRVKQILTLTATMMLSLALVWGFKMPANAGNEEAYAAVFDATFYAEHNPDLKAVFGNDVNALLNHFITCGMAEGRRGNTEFDVHAYKACYADLQAVFGEDLSAYYYHYISTGKAEGRDGSGGEPYKAEILQISGIRIPLIDGMQRHEHLWEYTIDELTMICAANAIKPGMNQREMAIAVNNFLCDHVEYDYTHSRHSAFDALAYGSAVCQGYANAYQRIMNSLGVPTDYVSGYAWSGREWGRHGWNRVLIDGNYYYVDVTWNDAKYDSYKNRYLLVSHEKMSRDHAERALNPRREM